MSAEIKLNWPIEDVRDGRGFRLPHEESSIPQDYIARNQSFWRKAKRGIASRPLELGPISGFLHSRIVKTFGLKDAEKPILTWSVIFDKPGTPSSEFVYAERYPDHIKEEDRQNWATGMVRLTEYATNYAAKEFFLKNADFPIARSISEVYGKIADYLTYHLLIGGTFARMGMVEEQAVLNGKDYKEALFKALFQHDFGQINELIADTRDYSDCSNIDDMAIQIGEKRFKKPDLGKWLDKLEVNEGNGRIKANVKNAAISVAAGGVYRNPGVTEISGAIPGLIYLETLGFTLLEVYENILNNPKLIPLLTSSRLDSLLALATSEQIIESLAPIALIYPFIAVHEYLHNYSSNKEFMGLIPARIIRKEKTPALARLEPER